MSGEGRHAASSHGGRGARGVDRARVRLVSEGTPGSGPVLYWMSRDQRAKDNWALLFAQELAIGKRRPLAVVFCLVSGFLGATARHYDFMLRGLREVERRLAEKGIPFMLLRGDPGAVLPPLIADLESAALVCDFDPLRPKRRWRRAVSLRVEVPVYEVDAHNVVPCWIASEKQEYAARTIRPKIRKLLPRFLTPYPPLRRHPFPLRGEKGRVDWEEVVRGVAADESVGPVDWIAPGEREAAETLRRFLAGGLSNYGSARNDPLRDGQSNLSPFLHFGQLSAQRAALEAAAAGAESSSVEAFLEELIVRRELSDNFCWHQRRYDSTTAFPAWARQTLDDHRRDRRPHLYTRRQFEGAETHDGLWNAAQREMVRRGKMHGYLRMYWAKMILLWSESPETALRIAVALNDRYELDGRDPNGYTGIAWSMGGVHDRPWPERPVFGKVRAMSLAGCRSKFDVEAYIRRWS